MPELEIEGSDRRKQSKEMREVKWKIQVKLIFNEMITACHEQTQ